MASASRPRHSSRPRTPSLVLTIHRMYFKVRVVDNIFLSTCYNRQYKKPPHLPRGIATTCPALPLLLAWRPPCARIVPPPTLWIVIVSKAHLQLVFQKRQLHGHAAVVPERLHDVPCTSTPASHSITRKIRIRLVRRGRPLAG